MKRPLLGRNNGRSRGLDELDPRRRGQSQERRLFFLIDPAQPRQRDLAARLRQARRERVGGNLDPTLDVDLALADARAIEPQFQDVLRRQAPVRHAVGRDANETKTFGTRDVGIGEGAPRFLSARNRRSARAGLARC